MLFEDRVLYPEVTDTSGPRERILRRWQRCDPSHIWIPSRLLPNRCRKENQDQKSAFHMLQRYESRDFENSFSVYSTSDSGASDPEEEYFHDYAGKSKICSSGSPGPNPPSTDSSDICLHRDLVAELSDRRSVAEEGDGLLDSEGDASDPEPPHREETSRLIEAGFVYHKKRPSEDTFERKVASKKEKRNKAKAKMTMPLDHFWQTVDTDELPKVDEFYESVMRERALGGASHRHVGVNDVQEFPRLRAFSERSPKESALEEKVKVEAFVEREEAVASAPVEEPAERVGGGILVMANIPGDVDREMVVALVSDYGHLLGLEGVGEFLTAEFWIPPEVELDWLISCFDGHQPFGAYSSVLHCYEKES